METPSVPFGPHVVMDISGVPEHLLSDYSLIFDFLYNLPEKIGMTRITQPYVFPYSGLVPEDEGITGITIIAESHISLHTFSKKNYAFMDIFSCKNFDTDKVIQLVKDTFPGEYTIKMFERGLDFPR